MNKITCARCLFFKIRDMKLDHGIGEVDVYYSGMGYCLPCYKDTITSHHYIHDHGFVI